MIRRCAIFGCDNTEEIALGHRFPNDRDRAQEWKDSLQLQEFPIELLQTKFCVCAEHFNNSDYEDDDCNTKKLHSAAIPKLKNYEKVPTLMESINNERSKLRVQVDEINSSTSASTCPSESIEIVAPTIATIERLHPQMSADYSRMHHSCQSIGSNSNTAYSHDDICILETHDSHYGNGSFNDGQDRSGILIQSIDAPDFTVLHAEDDYKYISGQKRHSMGAYDESAEVLLLEQSSSHKNAASHAVSGTDSDVEILMSEEILDSDWSATANNGRGGALVALCSTDSDEVGEDKVMIYDDANVNPTAASIPSSASNKIMDCTELDLSGDDFDFSQHSFHGYENLSRLQLINIIKEQSAKIRVMENVLNRYREAQRQFFQNVDVLRTQLNECVKYDSNGVGISSDDLGLQKTFDIQTECVKSERCLETIN